MPSIMFRKLCNRLFSWHVRIGCSPAAAPSPAIIFFPLRRATLCCGLAGILTVKPREHRDKVPPDERLRFCFEKIRDKNLRALLAGTIAVEAYLDGPQCLEEMRQAVQHLKGNEA